MTSLGRLLQQHSISVTDIQIALGESPRTRQSRYMLLQDKIEGKRAISYNEFEDICLVLEKQWKLQVRSKIKYDLKHLLIK